MTGDHSAQESAWMQTREAICTSGWKTAQTAFSTLQTTISSPSLIILFLNQEFGVCLGEKGEATVITEAGLFWLPVKPSVS